MQAKRIIVVASMLVLLGSGCSKHQEAANTEIAKPESKTEAPANTNKPPSGKYVYLTFDADMTPAMAKKLHGGQVSSWYSPGLISYLQERKIAATFFVTGMFAEIYPDAVKQWSKTPNFAIENHTYDHPGFESPCYGLTVVTTDTDKIAQMQKTQDILTHLTGVAPQYLRHPGLCHNKHDDDLAAQLHLKISDEGLASGDAFNPNTEAIVNNVVSHAQSGSVIVFHTGGPNAPATEAAIKEIVPKLQAQGYSFEHL